MAGPERDDYAALLKAVSMGDWNRTREFLELHPHALTARMTTFLGGTVLHAAIDAEQENIVEELVNMISEQDLETIKDGFGNTALHQTALNSGNYRVAECLIRKNVSFTSIRNDNNELPVALAMGWGQKELARYLYSSTPLEELEAEEGCNGASLLNYSIDTRDLDMALEFMKRCPSLAFALDGQDVSPFEKLAVATEAFESGNYEMEVERICPLSCKERLNKDGLTPKQLFTVNHQKLKEKGEKWMKGTTTSSTVVGALVITITFVAAFTIPGGNNQNTGLPILMDNKLFKIFMVTNTMSLFSSSTSVLTFLGILTARYAEEDFLKSLPKRMIIGLFTLFFSITTMMIAFSAALLLILHGQIWFVAPIIGLAGVPIILFALMQSRLLVDMVVSTYGSCIFNRKIKALL
ncbi:ankyrin repeat-containing protein ITN1-like [Juglans regia]|uniref:Ankyrin repeat-containing protein ITN1-like n=1 Tax=Juglans regia TaxID=51240 RepID=A0A6P9E6D8_JUGRE|nr:ankyrin repeat-containing protein ITN1-like [Juglans regia]